MNFCGLAVKSLADKNRQTIYTIKQLLLSKYLIEQLKLAEVPIFIV